MGIGFGPELGGTGTPDLGFGLKLGMNLKPNNGLVCAHPFLLGDIGVTKKRQPVNRLSETDWI
jgi:hypothetical protein